MEAGLGTAEDARLLAGSPLATSCLRVLIEPMAPQAHAALETAREILGCLDAASVHAPRLLHGFDQAAWPVLEAAVDYGYACRIGLEDTLLLPDGRPARDTTELVATAAAIAYR